MMLRRGVLVGSAALITLTLTAPSPVATAQTAPPPNFVFVLSDDQSVNTLAGMANVTALSQAGAKFDNAIISNPLCCPSRAAILTGLYSHNNGVYTNGDGEDPNGGYPPLHTPSGQNPTVPPPPPQTGDTTRPVGKEPKHHHRADQPRPA